MIRHIQIRTEEDVVSFSKNKIKEAVKRFPILNQFTNILEFVFEAFYRRDGLVFFQENKEGAYIQPDMVHGQYIYNLHIGILNRNDPLTILWSILHEYGHTQQDFRTEEIRLSPELTLDRETDAWEKAENSLIQFNLSKDLLENFDAFRKARLQKYQEKV